MVVCCGAVETYTMCVGGSSLREEEQGERKSLTLHLERFEGQSAARRIRVQISLAGSSGVTSSLSLYRVCMTCVCRRFALFLSSLQYGGGPSLLPGLCALFSLSLSLFLVAAALDPFADSSHSLSLFSLTHHFSTLHPSRLPLEEASR